MPNDQRTDLDDLIDAMDAVKAVLSGQQEKPGGKACMFPHCSCNSPWSMCERTGNRLAQQ